MARYTQFLLAATLALAWVAPAAAQSVGSRLERVMKLREAAELAQQERALSAAIGSVEVNLPTIVAITGGAQGARARLLLDTGVTRTYVVGDEVPGGWTVSRVSVDQVHLFKPGLKGAMRVAPLSFARRASSGTDQGPFQTIPSGPTAMPAIPPLPAPLASPASVPTSAPQAVAATATPSSDFVMPPLPGLASASAKK